MCRLPALPACHAADRAGPPAAGRTHRSRGAAGQACCPQLWLQAVPRSGDHSSASRICLRGYFCTARVVSGWCTSRLRLSAVPLLADIPLRRRDNPAEECIRCLPLVSAGAARGILNLHESRSEVAAAIQDSSSARHVPRNAVEGCTAVLSPRGRSADGWAQCVFI